MNIVCFHCNKSSTFSSKLGFRDECGYCRSDLHVCKNCEFYDLKSYNECRESSADVIRDKERANYCDFFAVASSQKKSGDEKEKLRAAAEALFKK